MHDLMSTIYKLKDNQNKKKYNNLDIFPIFKEMYILFLTCWTKKHHNLHVTIQYKNSYKNTSFSLKLRQ